MDDNLKNRPINLDLEPEEFRKLGYELIDKLSDYLKQLDDKKVTTGESPDQIRSHFKHQSLPNEGASPSEVLNYAYEVVNDHSMHLGHPKFWGFICGSGLPINWFADMGKRVYKVCNVHNFLTF